MRLWGAKTRTDRIELPVQTSASVGPVEPVPVPSLAVAEPLPMASPAAAPTSAQPGAVQRLREGRSPKPDGDLINLEVADGPVRLEPPAEVYPSSPSLP